MCLESEKKRFVEEEMCSMSIAAAFQTRGGKRVYATKKEREHEKVRQGLRWRLIEAGCGYDSDKGDAVHCRRIESIAGQMSKEFHCLLNGERMRIGIVQKALNLYLKYLWCIGRIPQPPHCPFDYGIINRLNIPIPNRPNWTEMDSIEEYQNLVQKANHVAMREGLSLAEWELICWNKDKQSRLTT